MRKFFFSLASVLLLAANVNATEISYVNMAKSRNLNGPFRMGNGTKQGLAIRIPKAKLQHLIGKTIESVDIICGTKTTKDSQIHPFITTSLDGESIENGDIAIGAAFKPNTWTLSKPYTITGEEENLFIGYTANVDAGYKPLYGDMTTNIVGYNYVFNDSVWVDSYDLSKGSAMISFKTKEDVEPYTDVIVNNLSYNNYYKAGKKYDFTTKFANVGTKVITSFETEVKVGDKTYTKTYDNQNIPAKSTFSFPLPTIESENDGHIDVKVTIKNINGNGNEDIDASDNVDNGTMFLYPSYMERSILLEGFTGQDCTACPSGHMAINSALAATKENMVEVMHHAGYYPDIFTMEESSLYTMYYNGSTFAPAVMVNRTTDYSIATAPVITTSTKDILSLISNAANNKPYVSLNLDTQLDEDTRQVIVKLSVKANEKIPTSDVLYNIFLVQDSIKAYQSSGGYNYAHNRALRKVLTGNAWGVILPELEEGESKVIFTDTLTIPEKLHSTYWKDNMKQTIDKKEYYVADVGTYKKQLLVGTEDLEAVLENMSVVAFVGEYNATDNTKNKIYNCVESKLGKSHMQWGYDYTAGVESVNEEPSVGIHVSGGKVSVTGDYDKLYVYSITGKKMDASATLAKGAYIVKVVANGKQTAKKILVR